MKRIRRMATIVLMVCVFMFVGSSSREINAKSANLMAMAETLLENKYSLECIYLDMNELLLNYATGKISIDDITGKMDLRETEIRGKLDALKELCDNILAEHQAATSDDKTAWKFAYNCVGQMNNACFRLMNAALKIERMGTYIRLSESWKSQYEAANQALELAAVRLDMSGIMWDLLMMQL